MTARSSQDSNPQDKSRCYERLRARVLGKTKEAFVSTSAIVLVRQGMSAWMQLDDKYDSYRLDASVARHHPALTRSMARARELLELASLTVVCPGEVDYQLADGIIVRGLRTLVEQA